jgi:hypothetical protein
MGDSGEPEDLPSVRRHGMEALQCLDTSPAPLREKASVSQMPRMWPSRGDREQRLAAAIALVGRAEEEEGAKIDARRDT